LAKDRESVPRKRRTREHVIADLSVNHVERLVLRCGWTIQRLNPDYGLDLFMQTFDGDGELENGEVWFQLKATDELKVLRRRQVIPVRLEWKDLLYWLNEAMPVILVIYDAASDRAWWLWLQESLREVGGRLRATVTAHVPLANSLDESAIRRFAHMRDLVREGEVPDETE
jgi:hypothetical protein